MFGLIAANLSAATANQENTLTAATDPDFTIQNNHFIFTGPYRLLADMAYGASVQYGRYDVAQWNGRGRPNIMAVNRNAVPTSPYFMDRYFNQNLMMPQNQEVKMDLTNNLASGTEAETLLVWIASQDWSQNEPPGQYDFIGHATATVTPTANAWKNDNAITFDTLPLGGVYLVLGAICIGGNAGAFRLNFPRTRLYQGRRMRPGSATVTGYGALPLMFGHNEWGPFGCWGAFHTFELPKLDLFGSAANSTTYDLFMKLRFLGEPVSLLDQFVNSNY